MTPRDSTLFYTIFCFAANFSYVRAQISPGPSALPTVPTTTLPSYFPSTTPSITPSFIPTPTRSTQPSPSSSPSNPLGISPTVFPTTQPSLLPTFEPLSYPSFAPSTVPSYVPSFTPSFIQSTEPSCTPTTISTSATTHPSTTLTCNPFPFPSVTPSMVATLNPSLQLTPIPTVAQMQNSPNPTSQPTPVQSVAPTTAIANPIATPSTEPTINPSPKPSFQPTLAGTFPTEIPSTAPSMKPTADPSPQPSYVPTIAPTGPTLPPTIIATFAPTTSIIFPSPTTLPSIAVSVSPSQQPSLEPTESPTAVTSVEPTLAPMSTPSSEPSAIPSYAPSAPTVIPTATPSTEPTAAPTPIPTPTPTAVPSTPTAIPSVVPSTSPTRVPSPQPTVVPTPAPSSPTANPTHAPSAQPSLLPTASPTELPSPCPTVGPSASPTPAPTFEATISMQLRYGVCPPFNLSSVGYVQPPCGVYVCPGDTIIVNGCPSYAPRGMAALGNNSSSSNSGVACHGDTTSVIEDSSGHILAYNDDALDPKCSSSPVCTGIQYVVPMATLYCVWYTVRGGCLGYKQCAGALGVYVVGSPTGQPTGQPHMSPTNAPLAQPTSQPSYQPSMQPSHQPSCQPSHQPISSPSAQPLVEPSLHPIPQPSSEPTNQPTAKQPNPPTCGRSSNSNGSSNNKGNDSMDPGSACLTKADRLVIGIVLSAGILLLIACCVYCTGCYRRCQGRPSVDNLLRQKYRDDARAELEVGLELGLATHSAEEDFNNNEFNETGRQFNDADRHDFRMGASMPQSPSTSSQYSSQHQKHMPRPSSHSHLQAHNQSSPLHAHEEHRPQRMQNPASNPLDYRRLSPTTLGSGRTSPQGNRTTATGKGPERVSAADAATGLLSAAPGRIGLKRGEYGELDDDDDDDDDDDNGGDVDVDYDDNYEEYQRKHNSEIEDECGHERASQNLELDASFSELYPGSLDRVTEPDDIRHSPGTVEMAHGFGKMGVASMKLVNSSLSTAALPKSKYQQKGFFSSSFSKLGFTSQSQPKSQPQSQFQSQSQSQQPTQKNSSLIPFRIPSRRGSKLGETEGEDWSDVAAPPAVPRKRFEPYRRPAEKGPDISPSIFASRRLSGGGGEIGEMTGGRGGVVDGEREGGGDGDRGYREGLGAGEWTRGGVTGGSAFSPLQQPHSFPVAIPTRRAGIHSGLHGFNDALAAAASAAAIEDIEKDVNYPGDIDNGYNDEDDIAAKGGMQLSDVDEMMEEEEVDWAIDEGDHLDASDDYDEPTGDYEDLGDGDDGAEFGMAYVPDLESDSSSAHHTSSSGGRARAQSTAAPDRPTSAAAGAAAAAAAAAAGAAAGADGRASEVTQRSLQPSYLQSSYLPRDEHEEEEDDEIYSWRARLRR